MLLLSVFSSSCSFEQAETDSLLDDFVFLPSGMCRNHLKFLSLTKCLCFCVKWVVLIFCCLAVLSLAIVQHWTFARPVR